MNIEKYYGNYNSFCIPDYFNSLISLKDSARIGNILYKFSKTRFYNEKNLKIYNSLVVIYSISSGIITLKDLENYSLKKIEESGIKLSDEYVDFSTKLSCCCICC
jgi:hypothetical protein